jgi:amino acid transporter
VTTATQEAPTLFLRKATGLVKGWSGFDAFAYSFMSVNLVTLGMFYSLATFAFVPDGSPVASIVLSAIGVTFMVIAYASLIAVMPRAGGDYVWQSRILDGIPGMITGAVVGGVLAYLVAGAAGQADPVPWGAGVVGAIIGAAIGRVNGGIGFILAATGWWFILAQWAPIYGAILNIEFFQPLAALLDQQDALTFLGTNDGIFFVSIVVILLTTVLVGLGMAGYANVQRACLWVGLAGLAVMFVLMLISSQDQFKTAFDQANVNMFGVEGAYDKTIADATANNFFTGPTTLNLFEFNPGTLMLIPFMLFWILYPNWGSTLYGEVRGASDFQRVLRGMLGGLWVTALLAIAFVFLAAKTFGWEFFNATNVNFLYYFYAYSDTATLPIWSYPPLLASYLIDSSIFQIAMVIVFGAWFLGWSGTLFLSSTRMIFAAAFDRVLPAAAAQVSGRRAVPVMALVLILVPSVVVSWLYAYNISDFRTLTLDATLVIAVTFIGTTFAATVLPWWKRDLYQNSPIARYSVAGLPIVSVAGALATIFLAWAIWMWIWERGDPSTPLYAIGVGNANSIIWLGVLYGVALVVYVVARVWRRSQGVDLGAIHAEIPSE